MSDEQTIKIKLKTAHVEIEYEGSEDFLRSDLLGFITKIAEIHKMSPPIHTPQQGTAPSGTATINLSVNSIATKLKVRKGPELVLAACAYLAIVENRTNFRREEILESMKTATTFYKKSYGSNFSHYLDRLVKNGKILQQSKGVYALSAQVRSEMELKLGS